MRPCLYGWVCGGVSVGELEDGEAKVVRVNSAEDNS